MVRDFQDLPESSALGLVVPALVAKPKCNAPSSPTPFISSFSLLWFTLLAAETSRASASSLHAKTSSSLSRLVFYKLLFLSPVRSGQVTGQHNMTGARSLSPRTMCIHKYRLPSTLCWTVLQDSSRLSASQGSR